MRKEYNIQEPAILWLEESLGSKITLSKKIDRGGNNKIYKITTVDDRNFVYKEYYTDDRDRMNREYSALKHLGENGFTCLPRTIKRDDSKNCAIYSYVDGSFKDPVDLSTRDVDQIVQFVLDLQSFKPEHISVKFDNAVLATDSFDTFSDTVLFRVDKFSRYIQSPDVSKLVLDFSKSRNLVTTIKSQLEMLRNQSAKAFAKKISYEERRLSPVDFGPHNMIFDENQVNFLDFEYFGWDDPVKIIPNLIVHEGSRGITEQVSRDLLEKYIKATPLQSQVKERLDTSLSLVALDWISILLWGLTPEKISARVFAQPDLDIENHETEQIAKIVRRLENLDVF